MLHDLLSLRQASSSTFNCSSYSKSSNKLAVVQKNAIFIINFKNGLLKKESVKMMPKDEYYNDYKLGEPQATVFPIIRKHTVNQSDEVDFLKGSLSECFFPSLGGGFQLLATSTSNGHVFLFKSPYISSTSSNYFWEKVSSLSDLTYQILIDPKINEKIQENDSVWIDRNINSKPLIRQFESVSNLEYKKRTEWMDIQCMDWSPIISNGNIENTGKRSNKNDNNNNNNNNSNAKTNDSTIALLSLGTKRGVIFFKCIIPTSSDTFTSDNISFLCFDEYDDWVTAIKWKPSLFSQPKIITNNNKNSGQNQNIIAISLGDGSVNLSKVDNEGNVTLLYNIIEKDYNVATLLEWSPPNENGETYLFICKGMGFYLYNFEKKQLSSLFLKHRATITCISFSDYYHFSTSSLDNNIIDFKIQPNFWNSSITQESLQPTSVNYLPKDDDKGLGVYSLVTSPNKLITIYLENLPPGITMYHSKSVTSRLNLAYRDPPYNFQSFKQAFLNKFEREKSKDLWDYFIYINVYPGESILEFINEICPDDNDKGFNSNALVTRCRLIIKLFYILKKKSRDLLSKEMEDKINYYKDYINLNYISECLKEFNKYLDQKDKIAPLEDYQRISLSLMAHYLKGTDADKYLNTYNKIMKIVDQTKPITDHCFYCLAEFNISEDTVESFIECRECESILERCSRTLLLLSSPKTLNCDFCCSKSLVLAGEDIKEQPDDDIVDNETFDLSSQEYQFPWIRNLFSNDQICIYCSTPLNGKINAEDVYTLK
ncbi:hypothetical protein ACTFIV_000619 [Dictyostelium citrinum]